MINHPLRLAVIGFNGSAQAALELFFNRYTELYQLVSAKEADALIYNADQPVLLAQQQSDYAGNYGSKPGVVVSIQDVDWPGMLLLKKPYSTDTLAATLSRLADSLVVAGGDGDKHAEQLRKEQVLAAYQQTMRRGRGEQNDGLDLLQQQAAQRKAFQSSLFERKRIAERYVDQFKQQNMDIPQEVVENTEQLKALLAEKPTVRNALSDLASVTDDDILGATAAVIKAHSTPAHPVVESTPPKAGKIQLLAVSEQDIGDCCGSSPDVSLKDPGQRRHVFFNAEGQLLALAIAAIERAHHENTPMALLGLPGQYLEYHPQTGQFYSNIDFDVFVQMAHVRFHFGELQLQAAADSEQKLQENNFVHYPADQLLWKLACWSSRGRLMEGMGLGTAYQLTASIPDNVVLDLPHTETLIRLWQTEPLSAIDVFERLTVAQRFVFPFMTAAWVLGWLQKQQPVAGAQPQPASDAHNK